MMRILVNKVFRHHSTILLGIIILALLLFIHVNINSQQVNLNLENKIIDDFHHDTNREENSKKGRTVRQSEEDESTTATTTNGVTTTITASNPSTTGITYLETTATAREQTTPYFNDTVELSVRKPREDLTIGHVNSHLWYKFCTVSMDSMRQHPLFPLWPGARGKPKMPDELESITTDLWTFQRVLGYIYPPVTGDYKFKIFSDTLAEFWLSPDSDARNATLLARNNKNPLLSLLFRSGQLFITSKPIYLTKGEPYYFEIQHSVNNVRRGKVRVRWMLPGDNEYTGIPNTSLSTFVEGENYLDENTRELLTTSAALRMRESILKPPVTYEWTNKTFAEPFKDYSSYTRENFHTVEFADHWKIMSAFNECSYAPSYTRKRDYKRYQGVYFTHYTDVFPGDDTFDKQWEDQKSYADTLGNTIIDEKDVIHLVNMFMMAVEEELPGEYSLINVINIERNFDKERGNRFLLELLLLETSTQKVQRISEYVYRFHNQPDILCKPKGIRWTPNIKINTILTTKSQGPWVIHYIENMAKIVHATGDKNVHFIVVDYGNNGVDVAAEFRRNNISAFTVIKKTGKFHKTLAIDEAAKLGPENETIIFLNDLHLVAPNSIFESVRKHTVLGQMTFTPVLLRLSQCSRPETKRLSSSGYWESFGYGIFSAHKQDWKSFGGVNVKEFKHKWGGEDWEMVDRVLGKGFEIERLRLPHFYHFYHDKTGMWQHARFIGRCFVTHGLLSDPQVEKSRHYMTYEISLQQEVLHFEHKLLN